MNTPQEQFGHRLRALMPQVDKVDERRKRFRHYLRDAFLLRVIKCAGLTEQERLVKAGESIEYWRTNGVDEDTWRYIVADFPRWWTMEMSKIRSKARKPDKGEAAQSAAVPPAVESCKPSKPTLKRKAKRNAAKKTLARRK